MGRVLRIENRKEVTASFIMSTLGEVIRFQREKLSMTQVQLGKALDVSGVTVHKWETDQLSPGEPHLEILATILNLDYKELVRVADKTTLAHHDEKRGIRLSSAAADKYPFIIKLILAANELDDIAVKYAAKYVEEVASTGFEKPRIFDIIKE